MIQINGKNTPDAEGMTIAAYLKNTGYDAARIAVERNEVIINKCDYATAVIEDGDIIEIVSFVGGG